MSQRERYWRRRLSELKSSGLSRAAFCRRHRLNYHTMTYWSKRLADLDGSRAGGGRTSFVEVALPASAGCAVPVSAGCAVPASADCAVPASAGYEVLLGNGRSIRLGAAFEDEAVARLIRTLESC